MKLNKIKQISKNLSKYFLISFSVLLTVFSISLTPQKVGHIEKSVSLFTHYQQNAILQTPKESNEWVKK